MIPKYHIAIGAGFAFIFWVIFPNTSLIYISLIFLSSFLIDFDHYIYSVLQTHKFRLKDAVLYNSSLMKQEEKDFKKNIKKKYYYHMFHTLEFYLILILLALLLRPFSYILIGSFLHAILDFVYMYSKKKLYVKEYLLFRYPWKKWKSSLLKFL